MKLHIAWSYACSPNTVNIFERDITLPDPSEASLAATTPYRLQLCRVSEGLASNQSIHHSTLTKPSRHVSRLAVPIVVSPVRRARRSTGSSAGQISMHMAYHGPSIHISIQWLVLVPALTYPTWQYTELHKDWSQTFQSVKSCVFSGTVQTS